MTPRRTLALRCFVGMFVALSAALLAGATPAQVALPPSAGMPKLTEAERKAVLRVSGIPDEPAEERQRRFAPLGRHLEDSLAIRVEYVVAPDYASVVDGLASGALDLAWVTGYHYLQARSRSAGTVTALVQREEDEWFRAVFVARAGSGIERLEDLRGRDFVFGAATSATGHLMPRYYLMQFGVDPDTRLAKYFYSGAHEATVNHVAAGRAVAGSLNLAVWKRLVAEGRVDTTVVDAFFETGRFNDYVWAVSGHLDAGRVERVREALLRLDPVRPEHDEILDLQRASRYIEVRERDYEALGKAARAAGLLD